MALRSSISGAGLATSPSPEMAVSLVSPEGLNTPSPAVKSQRLPTYIRGTGKKSSGMMFAPKLQKKRTVTHAAIVAITVVIVLAALGTVLPLTGDGHAQGINAWISSIMSWSQQKDSNTALVASQIATATAVTQDGYDPGDVTFAGVQAAPASANSGGLNRFFYGQCTYWANKRYHDLTGVWVPWLGNADEWAWQAPAYGWNTSSTPRLHSIMVFQPYIEGAGYYGHVAIVESINGTDILTSNWNAAGAAWATTTYIHNYPRQGVTFIWAPGK